MSTRVYVVADSSGKFERLVRASAKGIAARHVSRVHVATQFDLERLISQGVKVEAALEPVMPPTPSIQPNQ